MIEKDKRLKEEEEREEENGEGRGWGGMKRPMRKTITICVPFYETPTHGVCKPNSFHISTSHTTYPWQPPRSNKYHAVQVDSMDALGCRDNTVHPSESFLVRTVWSLLCDYHHPLLT